MVKVNWDRGGWRVYDTVERPAQPVARLLVTPWPLPPGGQLVMDADRQSAWIEWPHLTPATLGVPLTPAP